MMKRDETIFFFYHHYHYHYLQDIIWRMERKWGIEMMIDSVHLKGDGRGWFGSQFLVRKTIKRRWSAVKKRWEELWEAKKRKMKMNEKWEKRSKPAVKLFDLLCWNGFWFNEMLLVNTVNSTLLMITPTITT